MKTWFISGTSSGFGRALAEALVAKGERVIATARKVDSLRSLVALAPDRVTALELDVTNAEHIARAREAAGPVDVVVNNAGFSIIGAVEETDERALRDAMETMFFGAANVTRAFVPAFRARKSGTFVQISSVGGQAVAPGFSAYCAAKFALEGFSETLATELGPFGVKVLIVEPGAYRTELFGPAFRSLPQMPEYAATVGQTRKYVEANAGTQPGDPKQAARAIIDAVEQGVPNLRLVLGDDAIAGVRAKVEALQRDVDAAGKQLGR